MSRQKQRILDHQLATQVLKHYFEVTTPIFTPEMGTRLARARKVMKLTQRQLAEQLSLSQAQLSRLENGKMMHAPCNSARFSSVLGDHFLYVLTRSLKFKYEELTEEYNKQSKQYKMGLRLNRKV